MLKLPGVAFAALLAMPLAVPAQGRVAYVDSVPGTLVRFRMVPVPGGRVTYAVGGSAVVDSVGDFWIGTTEVTWDLYDIFAFRLDVPIDERPRVDARARPSRPYGAPDRGFGHAGHPAISVTHAAAVAFAEWLSLRTGHTYRVATETQWMHAAALGPMRLAADAVAAATWSSEVSDDRTHPVGTRAADPLGLHDMLGNAAEWVTARDGTGVLRGGSYLEPLDSLRRIPRALQQPWWNQTDPQVPRSRWWLSDATFTGFRIVRIP